MMSTKVGKRARRQHQLSTRGLCGEHILWRYRYHATYGGNHWQANKENQVLVALTWESCADNLGWRPVG